MFHLLLISNHCFYMIFRKARSKFLLQSFISSSVFVFLSALWEQMTNDKERSTSCSLKRQEKCDLSLLLTSTTFLCSDSLLNLSLFSRHFSSVTFVFFLTFDLYSQIEGCHLKKVAILIASRSVWREIIWIVNDNLLKAAWGE